MAYPRFWHNLVTLPDGQVLAIGGGTFMYTYASTAPACFRPRCGIRRPRRGRRSSSMSELRMYHSTAPAAAGRPRAPWPVARATVPRPLTPRRSTRRPTCSRGPGRRSAPPRLRSYGSTSSSGRPTPRLPGRAGPPPIRHHAMDRAPSTVVLPGAGGIDVDVPTTATSLRPATTCSSWSTATACPRSPPIVNIPACPTQDAPGADGAEQPASARGGVYTANSHPPGPPLPTTPPSFRYNVHRSTTSGFTPSTAQPARPDRTDTSFADNGLRHRAPTTTA